MTSGCPASIGFDTAAVGRRRIDWSDGRGGRGGGVLPALCGAAVLLALLIAHTDAQADAYKDAGVGSQSQRRPPPHQWTTFVKVDGQPEPVPAEWVATPEGRFAHSLKIPDPVPKDSGYRWWMSSKDYFKHLCDTEAGEFIYEKVENVEGFLFMRPPRRPSDSDLMDLRALEAPGFQAPYSTLRDAIAERGSVFVSSSIHGYQYIEEPAPTPGPKGEPFLEARGDGTSGIELKMIHVVDRSQSEYGLTWRGIRRKADRSSHIAGFEAMVVVRATGRIIGVWRDYVWSAQGKILPSPVIWLNAVYCPRTHLKVRRPELEGLPEFVKHVLVPKLQVELGSR